jgi:hypothetical protein
MRYDTLQDHVLPCFLKEKEKLNCVDMSGETLFDVDEVYLNFYLLLLPQYSSVWFDKQTVIGAVKPSSKATSLHRRTNTS